MNCDIKTMSFEVESSLTRFDELCFANCSTGSIYIPCSIDTFGSSCFFNSTIRKMTFENKSRLEVIEPSCFENCILTRIEITRTIEHLGQSWFSNSTIGIFIGGNKAVSFPPISVNINNKYKSLVSSETGYQIDYVTVVMNNIFLFWSKIIRNILYVCESDVKGQS
jgi:hypothetical protein